MTRLIDADALNMYERLKSYYGDAWRDAQEEIDNAPTIDAEPVRHGKWITYCKTKDSNLLICSECKMLFNVGMGRIDESHYCPNCGARMDAERKEE